MTGYHISIGYQSGGPDKEEAWEILKRVVLELCHSPHRLADEAVRFGMGTHEAFKYASAYASASEELRGTEDSTLRIIEANELSARREEGTVPQVMQLAGGSGESRVIKEAMRRAFCRLVMAEMHKREIEININVA